MIILKKYVNQNHHFYKDLQIKTQSLQGLIPNYFHGKNKRISRNISVESFKIVGYGNMDTPICNRTICELNRYRNEVRVTNSSPSLCFMIEDCVTAVVKTAKRLHNIVTLIHSLRRFFRNMLIIVTYELHDGHMKNREFQTLLRTDGKITYIQGPHGISNGRNVGVRHVTTKYFLLLDDDFHFSKDTNIRKMVDMLDRSDLSLVGGVVQDSSIFEGAFRVYIDNLSRTQIIHFTKVTFETIPYFPSCFAVDIVKNFFMAKTKDVIKAGGWNDSLLVMEHEHFFFNLRLANFKVALCTDIVVKHYSLEGFSLMNERFKVAKKFEGIFHQIWDIHDITRCGQNYYLTNIPINKIADLCLKRLKP